MGGGDGEGRGGGREERTGILKDRSEASVDIILSVEENGGSVSQLRLYRSVFKGQMHRHCTTRPPVALGSFACT